ncbi:hypothetical protein IU500_02630 [Nocardia terpenica]|uniref:hypothetical protein n=1 Tax=Nocardia terpenica TaxID=455432 RepID=UPI0018930D8E|nr:hypothetical protein [Nocardia terpenica]MBF6102934.1 hypothetical protein [Nocardia terpenica]MBF6110877.1 hypothetical protein [Nocardia terpenica]MBF6117008.1 hypothetical protein [Nocardia terpenica]
MGQQQPAWGQQQAVWDQQQPSAWGQQPPQVWGQPGYPGGYSPQPPKKSAGLIVGIVLGVVAVLVIGVGIVVLATRHKSDNAASAAAATPSLVPATTSSTATGRPTTTPSSSASSRFSYQEQAKDWNFKLGDVSLHADWVAGVDHPTCADIEKNGKLTSLGCQYAAEMVYRAEDGGLMLTQFVMGMADADKASAASGQYSDADLNLRPGSYIDHFAVGKWKDGAQGQYLVLTMVTATDAVDEDTAKKYLRYLHADMLGALTFR